MKISQLEAILSVINNDLNISKAANALQFSQPYISKLIAEFEKQVACPVFIRNGKNINGITIEGQQIVKAIRQIHYQTQIIKNIGVDFNHTKGRGQINILADRLFAESKLPEILVFIQQNFVDVQYNITVINPDAIDEKSLVNNDLLLLSRNCDTLKLCSSYKLFDWEYYCLWHSDNNVFENAHFISLPRLAGVKQNLITLGIPKQLHLEFNDMHLQSEPFEAKIQSDSLQFVLQYITNNLGVAIVPSFCIKNEDDLMHQNILHKKLPNIFSKNAAYIHFRKNNIFRPYVYQLFDFLGIEVKQPQMSNFADSEVETNRVSPALSLENPIKITIANKYE